MSDHGVDGRQGVTKCIRGIDTDVYLFDNELFLGELNGFLSHYFYNKINLVSVHYILCGCVVNEFDLYVKNID
ncbi:hypothetical protein MASR1M31_07240 [Porphyromonadaceae bacterium]